MARVLLILGALLAALAAGAASALEFDCNDPVNVAANCGFETGDFSGWLTQDIASPFFALTVDNQSPGYFGFFTGTPPEGSFAVLHGFDGGGPGTIEVSQDVTVGPSAVLLFNYRAAWDLLNFAGATLDRTFEVSVEPAGGGAPLQTDLILTAAAGTVNLDTGTLDEFVDLSAFAGMTVRVNFVWTIPESFSGPALFQLDNVLIRPKRFLVEAAVVAGASLALENAGGTLRLEQPELNGLGPTVFAPEPGFLWQLGPGLVLLGILRRGRMHGYLGPAPRRAVRAEPRVPPDAPARRHS